MTNPPHEDPRSGPPRPRKFSAGTPPHTPGLPQATPDPQPSRNGGDYAETPSRALAGRATATAVDARGRAITARKLNLLEYYKLTKLLGEDAKNERQMDLASIAVSVTEIDGEEIIFPATELEVQHLLQRLEFDGIAAVAEAMKSLNPNEGDTAKN